VPRLTEEGLRRIADMAWGHDPHSRAGPADDILDLVMYCQELRSMLCVAWNGPISGDQAGDVAREVGLIQAEARAARG